MNFMFGRRRASGSRLAAETLHDALVAAIRQPAFYLGCGVPDTFEGRFDLLVLHVAIVLRHLRGLKPDGEAVAQELVDTMFARFDIAMRELGVGDLAVPKRMKRLAEAFNGRTTAYQGALDANDEQALATAVGRNVLNGSGDGIALARYASVVDRGIESIGASVLRGDLPALPDPAHFHQSA